ncbi:hypothetical protein P9112_006695 [Eukaryota sp. TZLM1-RC]
MPRYYCEYCDVYLAFDSPSVRKDHNEGWKHKGNVRNYWAIQAQSAASLASSLNISHAPLLGVPVANPNKPPVSTPATLPNAPSHSSPQQS